jgi:hypothetical protein
MLTARSRAIVSALSLATVASSALAVAGCARGPSPVTWDGASATEDGRLVIRFENESEAHVDVYLVGELRQWWLGRVAPGARVTLRVPEPARASVESGFARLAALADAPVSGRVAADPRATFTIAQPVSSLLDQRWTFRQDQVSAPELFGASSRIPR